MAEHRTKMKRTGSITLSAVLLAGGESRRMGRDKATMELDGEPMWQRQFRILRALKPERIFVSARTAPPWLPNDVELLLDDPPSRGPLSGLTKALAASRTTHVMTLAVDMPFMTAEELRRLCRLADEDCGVVPEIAKRAEPLAAIYPQKVLLDFAAALRGSDFSMQTLVRKLAATAKVRLLPIGDESVHLYENVNEPSDLKEGRFLNRPRS
jgi:molybdopterin-guanine dinucleotide biosynthesis protein A